jgi:hypothetical protein
MDEGRQHQRRGTATEAVVTGRLLHHGFGVSKPAFGNERYDLILDDDGTLQRVQVKTAYPHNQRSETAVVEFDTTLYGSDGRHSGRTTPATKSTRTWFTRPGETPYCTFRSRTHPRHR